MQNLTVSRAYGPWFNPEHNGSRREDGNMLPRDIYRDYIPLLPTNNQ